MRRYERRYLDREFIDSIKQLYPGERSMRKMTARLNRDILQDLNTRKYGGIFKFFSNKKGSLLDFVYIVGVIIFLSIVALVIVKSFTTINDTIQILPQADNQTKAVSSSINTNLPKLFDWAIVLGFILFTIMIFFLASLVRIHPLFFIPYILLTIGFVAGSIALSNAYANAATNDMLAEQAAQMPLTSSLMLYLPVVLGILSFVLAIFMYKNYREGE